MRSADGRRGRDQETETQAPMMDPLTIMVALLTAGVAMLAFVGWMGHRDTIAAIGRMDRAATTAERAADGAREAAFAAREAALAANRSAEACIAMAEQVNVLVQHFIRRQQPGPT